MSTNEINYGGKNIGAAFTGMMFQLVLIKCTQGLDQVESANGKLVGNAIFWVSFTIIGQPVAALMYFYAWQAKYGSVSKGLQLSSPPMEENLAMKILLPHHP